jgi:NhaP-type Na+/H+ or K+/H+ antiporter
MSAIQPISVRKPINRLPLAALIGLAIIVSVLLFSYSYVQSAGTQEYIVQANDVDTAAAMVAYVGGEVTHELGVINAVGAKLSESQLRRLYSTDVPLRIYLNSAAQVGNQD